MAMKSKAIVMRQIEGRKGEVYYPIEMAVLDVPRPTGHQLLIGVTAAAINHRDLYLRQHLYPEPRFGVALCSDGVGVVMEVGPEASGFWMKRRVIINPGQGWVNDPEAAESPYGYLTLGASPAGTGTLQQYMLVDEADVVSVPEHLTDTEAAALPSAALTAWRALMVRSGNALPGRNILIPGIGGGVALFVLSFALAAGCKVYVTSSCEEKLRRAKELGASGGTNYTQPGWELRLLSLLPPERNRMDAIIDGAGGSIVESGVKLLRQNGVIVSYGMTLSPSMPYTMRAVIRNLQLVGTTMGSRKDFMDMVESVRVNKIRAQVCKIVRGIDDLNELESFFEVLANGLQFGKLVVEIDGASKGSRL